MLGDAAGDKVGGEVLGGEDEAVVVVGEDGEEGVDVLGRDGEGDELGLRGDGTCRTGQNLVEE